MKQKHKEANRFSKNIRSKRNFSSSVRTISESKPQQKKEESLELTIQMQTLNTKLFIYNQDTKSFVTSLKSIKTEEQKHIVLQENTNKIISAFNDFIKTPTDSKILDNIVSYISVSQDILIKNFEDISKEIMHEKANLLFRLNSLKKEIVLLSA